MLMVGYTPDYHVPPTSSRLCGGLSRMGANRRWRAREQSWTREGRPMLSAEKNEILTRVGPGTPMGNLLRRYWTPACLSSEVAEPDGAPARVRLLGEDLVAFRDTSGTVGLIEERCPHRGASVFYGRNEECGLRCTYH